MHQISIIVFREFLEISLLIGLLSSVGKNIKDFKIILVSGIMLGVFGASLLAFFTDQISNSLEGAGGEIFDAIVILMTVVLLCATLVWMRKASHKIKQKASSLASEMRDDIYSKTMFTILISTTIFREGAEIVLLLHSFYTIAKDEALNYINGFALGALAGILCGVAFYIGLFKFASRYIFSITSFLMTFIAAGLATEAAKILSSVGIISDLGGILWDTSPYIDDASIVGRFLKVFIGYTAKPTGIELVFYLSTLAIIFVLDKVFSGKNS
ncbi:MAG: FTR1 family protein [Rickettsiaceae bacterium]|nr:FTR1 family protein [Rickettsiaceae bacterium]